MKNKLIRLFLLIFVLLSACTERFIDRKPITQVTEASYWENNVDNLKLYANRYYQQILPRHAQWIGGPVWLDRNSDNLSGVGIGSTGGNSWIFNLINVTTDLGYYSYENIRGLNIAISNFDKYQGNTAANQYMGEIYFFRAIDYFGKLRIYGSVPYIDRRINETDTDVIYSEQMPRYDLAKKIIEDMDKAITLLNNKASVELGRLSKEAALAYKSRVALFEGTWEKYHRGTVFGVEGQDGTEFLQMAESASKELIDMGTCEIYDTDNPSADYKAIFITKDLTNMSEAILWAKYDFNLQTTHNLQRYAGQGGAMGMTKDLVESYLCTDGRDITTSPLYQGDASIADVVKNRDWRLVQTVAVPGVTPDLDCGLPDNPSTPVDESRVIPYDYNYLTGSGELQCPTGYVVQKYRDPKDCRAYQTSDVGETPWIIFRYAEVLLNYAEAKAELGTLTNADLDISINLLRNRAGMPNMTTAVTSGKKEFPGLSDLINEIRRERRVEMAVEGYRLDDLKRWAQAVFKLNGVRPLGVKYNVAEATPPPSAGSVAAPVLGRNVLVDANGYVDFFQRTAPGGYTFRADRDYLGPIPLAQININNKLKQNPGW